jgi:hypothetical protein
MGALSGLMGGQGVSINIGSLVTVEGNATDDNIDSITSKVDSSLNRLKRALVDGGKITNVNASYL